MLRTSTIVICMVMSVLLVSCPTSVAPTISASPTTQTHLLPEVETEVAVTPTIMATATRAKTPISNDPAEVLETAVANLLNAASFEMTAHEVRAYQIIDANGETKQVY